jgi:hypothetical protein
MRWGGLAVAGLAIVLLAWFVVSCIRDIGIAGSEQTVIGSVVSVAAWSGAPGSRSGRSMGHGYIVRYRYAVQGKSYETSVVREASAIPAAAVDVYYDADDPSRSALDDFEDVSRRSRNALALFLLGLVLFAAAGWIAARKSARKQHN